MKLAAVALSLALSVSVGAYGQDRGGRGRGGGGFRTSTPGAFPFNTYGSSSGFGNILFPGTGHPPPFSNPFSSQATFAERLGATVSGFPGFTGAPSGGFRGRGHGGSFPVVLPVFVGGGFYDNPYAYQQQAPPNVTIVMPPPQAVPPVTINQYAPETQPQQPQAEQPEAAPQSGIRSYQAPTAQRPEQPADDQVRFFVALKDNSVYTALAYWVEDGTLHYITTEGRHNQVSLDLVDRETSAKLNEGRKVEFRLPPAR